MHDDFLRGKKILFVGPVFYNYHYDIVAEIQNMGASVDFYNEKPDSIFYRIINNYFKKYKQALINNYLNSILNKCKDGYDFVFVIRGEIITNYFLSKLKKSNPNAKFIMYQWDSIEFTPNYPKIMNFFDKVMTFDIQDSKRLNIKYLPLFYNNDYKNIELSNKRIYDIAFFGSYHSDRLEIIKQIDYLCKKSGLRFYYHLYSPKLALFRKLLNRSVKVSDLKYFKTYSVDSKKVLEIYRQSKAVLDIERDIQSGLTMRTLEVLGAGLKLITTNKAIYKEEIYDESNILLIDRYSIKLKKDFLLSSIKSTEIINKYNINNWILNVFNFDQETLV